MQCGGQRHARRAILRHHLGELRLSRIEIERVRGKMRLQPLERAQHGVRRLAVVTRRIGFPPPFQAVPVREAHPHDARVVIAAPRDDERVLGLERDDFGDEP